MFMAIHAILADKLEILPWTFMDTQPMTDTRDATKRSTKNYKQ